MTNSTLFKPRQTLITSGWLNDVNNFVYKGVRPPERTAPLITEIDATDFVDGELVYAQGRTSVNDGGGGFFTYYQSTALPVDGGIVFAPKYGLGRLVRDGYTTLGFATPMQLLWWGLPTDGTTPIDSVLSAARSFATTQRAATFVFPPGTYIINTTQVNRQDSITWVGQGGGPAGSTSKPVQEIANASATIIKASSTFTLNAPMWVDANQQTVGAHQRYQGGLKGVTLWGNARANGLEVQSCIGANYQDILTLQCKSWGVKIGAGYDNVGGPIGSCSNNNFTNVDTIFCPIGFVLWGDVTVVSNASLNVFQNCNARGGNTGWSLENCDSNFFYGCGGSMVLHAEDTGTYSVGGLRSARANVIVGFQGGLIAKAAIGGGEPSYRNIVLGFTKENNASLTVEPGAKLIALTDQVTPGSDTAGQLIGREAMGVLAKKTSTGNVNNATLTDIFWGTNTYDHLDAHGVGAHTFTIPGGVSAVRISIFVVFDPANTTGKRELRLFKNGSNTGMPKTAVDASISNTVYLHTAVLQVVAGDVFKVMAYQDSGSSVDIMADSSAYFNIEYL